MIPVTLKGGWDALWDLVIAFDTYPSRRAADPSLIFMAKCCGD